MKRIYQHTSCFMVFNMDIYPFFWGEYSEKILMILLII